MADICKYVSSRHNLIAICFGILRRVLLVQVLNVEQGHDTCMEFCSIVYCNQLYRCAPGQSHWLLKLLVLDAYQEPKLKRWT